MMKRSLQILLLSLMLLLACMMRRASMWIESESTATDLTFMVAQERGGTHPVLDLDYIAVRTCPVQDQEQVIVWQSVGLTPSSQEIPTRYEYGVAPLGFRNQIGPKPLTPGCYEASISGQGIAASVRLVVRSDGRVEEMAKSRS